MVSVLFALTMGVALGAVIGWLAHASRTSTMLGDARTDAAQARAELAAAQSSRDLTASSLAAASEDAARRQSTAIGAHVGHIVEPLRGVLGQLTDELRRVEHHRAGAYSGLFEQIRGMQRASLQLGDQTRQLANALHTPHLRGRWGELQLERIVELSGMTKHCDFTTQRDVAVGGADGSDGVIRPDLIVHLAGDRDIVVDAKVPLHAYLQATAVGDADTDEAQRHLGDHARAVRSHINSLAAKAYASALPTSAEMVVLFLPSDAVLEAAARADPELIEFGFGKNVVLATPATLMALLRTVALGWRHDAMARDAAVIHELGIELHQRMGSVLSHFDRVGGSLRKAVDAYNSTLGVVETRMGVTARKLSSLEALNHLGEVPSPHPVHTEVRRDPDSRGLAKTAPTVTGDRPPAEWNNPDETDDITPTPAHG